MNIKNVNKVIYPNGDTSDIIKVVMYAYEIETDPQIKVLAEQLRGKNDTDTCRNIFNYLIKKIKYKADSDGTAGELIKSPARLIVDGTGDCKSYSLFTAVILRWLDIPHVFRFASYSNTPEATHVYVVTDDNIVIDAVAGVQLNYPFNKEKKYNFKCDMANSGTKISYLAGFGKRTAKKSVKGVNDNSVYSVWLGDENQFDITPGKSWLYGKYDLISEMIKISQSNAETAKLYNQLAIISALIWAYNHVSGNTESLKKMALIICGMIKQNRFESQSVKQTVRDTWFNQILSDIQNIYSAEYVPTSWDIEWMQAIITEVLENNVLPEKPATVGSIGNFDPIADGLKSAGIYFIYLFIPESELKNYPDSVAKKRKTQMFFADVINAIDVFHNWASIMDFFRAGIIARTGKQPEDYINSLKASNVKIGAITLIAIATILSIILGLIEIIKAIWPASNVGNYAVSSGAADLKNEVYTLQKKVDNLTGGNGSNTGVTSVLTSSTGLIGAGLIGAYFLLKK
ncbi:MAG: transglutaminase-like domain-containing protein [Paludibacter sp.]